MNILLWIVQIVLAGMFLMAGVMKAFQYDRARENLFWVKDVPRGLVTFIGFSELLGGVGLILPAVTGIFPWLTPLAAMGIALIMLFAGVFHARRREPQAIVFNIVLLILAGLVVYGRWVMLPL